MPSVLCQAAVLAAVSLLTLSPGLFCVLQVTLPYLQVTYVICFAGCLQAPKPALRVLRQPERRQGPSERPNCIYPCASLAVYAVCHATLIGQAAAVLLQS